jgi:hypothetical protein
MVSLRSARNAIAATAALVAAAVPSARADVAYSCVCGSRPAEVMLYFVDGPLIVRAVCPLGTQLFDRATCRSAEQVKYAALFALTDGRYAEDLATATRERDDTVTKLMRVEAKIEEYLSVSVPVRPVDGLTHDLAVVTQRRDEITTTVRGLEDQVARLEAALRAAPSEDLAGQLALVTAQLATQRGQQRDLDAQIKGLRDQLIAAYGDLSAVQDLAELQRQRGVLAARLAGGNERLGAVMDTIVEAKRQVAHVVDQGFTWEVLAYSRTVANDALFAARFETDFDLSIR